MFQLILNTQGHLDSHNTLLQTEFQKLIPKTASPEERAQFIQALTIYFHKYTFDEILDNPSVRLSKITNKGVLEDLLLQHNTDERLINTNFRDLPISLRNDKDIALAFPGKIQEEDFAFMYPSLLSDFHFVQSVIIKSINR
jgi:hypothetical protein